MSVKMPKNKKKMGNMLLLEANLIPLPENQQNTPKLDDSLKRKVFQQEYEVHLLKLWPVDDEIREKLVQIMRLDNLPDLIDATMEFSWNSGPSGEPLSYKFFVSLLVQLEELGYKLAKPKVDSIPPFNVKTESFVCAGSMVKKILVFER